MIKQQQFEKSQRYKNILHYQIREKEIEKQLKKKDSIGENMFARGNEYKLFTNLDERQEEEKIK
jgi:hypothetical protein